MCKECFFWAFETEIHQTIIESKLFRKKQTVAVAASGGKDSTVLAYVLKLLNEKYKYGLKLVLLSVDEGITGKYKKRCILTVVICISQSVNVQKRMSLCGSLCSLCPSSVFLHHSTQLNDITWE